MRVSEEIDSLWEEIAWFLDHLAAEKAASLHTVAAYENDLLQVADLFRKKGGMKWTDFDAAACNAFFSLLSRRRYSASTVQRKTAALRAFLKFLITRRCGPAEVPESSGVRKAKALPKALTKDQLDKLLAKPDITLPAGLRDRTILEILYGTGLRVTELVSLRLEHYVPGESVLRVHGKREKTRIIPIPAVTHVWLREYLENGRPHLAKPNSGSYIFLNQRGSALSRSGVFRLLRDYANRAKIDADVSPHTLRHTYAVHLVQAGADLRSVQELLGHASVATTEVYTHLDIETIRRKYNEAHPRARNRRLQ